MIRKIFIDLIRKENLILIILLLSFSRFLGPWGTYIMIFLFPLIYLYKKFSISFDNIQLIILLFSITYVVFLLYNNISVTLADYIYFLIFPVLFYKLGRYFGHKYSEKYLLVLVFTIMTIQSFNWMVVILYIAFQTGTIINLRLFDFEGSTMAATLLAVSFSIPAINLGFIAVTPNNSFEKSFKKLILIFALLATLSSVFFVNRSILIIIVTSLLVVIFIFLIERKYFKLFQTLILYLILAISIYLLPQGLQIIETYKQRELSESEDQSFRLAGGRVYTWSVVAKSLLHKPLGNTTTIVNYAHNLWLDVAKKSGIVPAVLLLIGTIYNIIYVVKLVRSRCLTLFFNVYILLLLLSFLLTNSIEPIIEGAFYHFLLYMMFWGIIKSLVIINRPIQLR